METTWNGTAIITDTAYLPFAFCAWLESHRPVNGPIAYGHSEEQARERLIEDLMATEDLCECDGDDPSVGYVGSTCAWCRGELNPQRYPAINAVYWAPDAPVIEYSQATQLDADAWDAERRVTRVTVIPVPRSKSDAFISAGKLAP